MGLIESLLLVEMKLIGGGMSNRNPSRVRGWRVSGVLAALTVCIAACSGPGYGKADHTLSNSGGGKASRPLEEVRSALEHTKGSLYAIYNQALLKDGSLQGKVVVEFTIAANGKVTECHFVTSELKSADLEQKLLGRLCSMQLAAENVNTLVTRYPIDFVR